MKSHATRRSLWLLNVPLGLCVCAVVGWYAFDVRLAVAAAPVPDARTHRPPAYWQRIDADFQWQLDAASRGVLQHPVTRELLEGFLLDPANARMAPPHFPFCGPRPSGVRSPPPPPGDPPPPLETLGRVRMVLQTEEHTTFTFMFSGEESPRFCELGAYLRPDAGAKHHYLLRAAHARPAGHVEIEYAAYTVGDDTVHFTGFLGCDPYAAARTDVIQVAMSAAAGPATRVGIMPPRPGLGGLPAGPVPVNRLQPLRPRITPDPDDPRKTHVELDDTSAALLRSEAGAKLLESMKTRSRTLPDGQRAVEILDAGDVPLGSFALKRGDMIYSIEDQRTPDREAILRVGRTISPEASRVTIVVNRNGRKLTFVIDPRDNKTRRKLGQAVARMGEAE